eukprot:GHVH01007495.1.p1 GENE.GHVH01007495.1~~GHVH01007495.1.p1  ORF type:complete len:269 (+),score=41.18 GHVH01007495.1:636-1442(+)
MQALIATSPTHIPYILVSGGGYPDEATRLLVQRLVTSLELPVYYLGDLDPHGVAIFLSYRSGGPVHVSKTSPLALPTIQWIGINCEDAQDLPGNALLDVTHSDLILIEKLVRQIQHSSRKCGSRVNSRLTRNLEFMTRLRKKAEIESAHSRGITYLSSSIVLPRLKSMKQWRDHLVDNIDTGLESARTVFPTTTMMDGLESVATDNDELWRTVGSIGDDDLDTGALIDDTATVENTPAQRTIGGGRMTGTGCRSLFDTMVSSIEGIEE